MKKQIIGIFLCLMMCLILFSAGAFAADEPNTAQNISLAGTDSDIPYRYYDSEAKQFSDATCLSTDYTKISNTTTWNAKWFVVSGNVTIESLVTVKGNVNLILVNGCNLQAKKGIKLTPGNSLTIYAQTENDKNNPGSLTTENKTKSCAGIGGQKLESCGILIIHGGKITARGGDQGAGIGGGGRGNGGTVTIYGGNVNAYGGNQGAGIGGGYNGTGIVFINDGNVYAEGGNQGAGIGGGCSGNGGVIQIDGGAVKAHGGNQAAGIGGGGYADAGNITVSNGAVDAYGGEGKVMNIFFAKKKLPGGAGIGCGGNGTGGTVDLIGGIVNTYGGAGVASESIPDADAIKAEQIFASPHDNCALEFKTAVSQETGKSYSEETQIQDDLLGLNEIHMISLTIENSGESDITYHYVRFNMEGHGNKIATQKVVQGGKAIKPANPTETDWQFEGWYTDASFTTQFNFNTAIMAETVIYAKWTYAEEEKVLPFEDVNENDYYYNPVLWAYENVITNGTDTTHFSPNGVVTRAQAVSLLWRTAGREEPQSMNVFSDVPTDAYYAKAVAWAMENGITAGVGEGKFAPASPCTRAQIVTFLYRFDGEQPLTVKKNPFEDVTGSDYYYDAVLWAAENGITNGTTATTFSPAENCLRSQTVTFLYRCAAE